LIGEDPSSISKLIFNLKRFVYRTLGFGGSVVQAISGVEIALWDIIGKVKNEPICKLLGDLRDQIKLYAAGTIVHDKPAEWHVKSFEKHFLRKRESGEIEYLWTPA
jgi:L-alanine-DL-glutamate epimerase-like enolase superfamily enzyme